MSKAITFKGKQVTLHGLRRFAYIAWDDVSRAASFWLGAGARRKQHARYRQCKTMEDYFQFSKEFLELTQVPEEILGFLRFAEPDSPQHVAEIGTLMGGTNFMLSQAIPGIKLMIGLDLYVQNAQKLRYFARPDQEMHYLNGSSYAPQTVEKVEGIMKGRKFDVLFIDGDHSYEGVKQDFLCYRHLVRENGIVAFHDIVPDYKTRFGKDTGCWVGDVPVFWNKIKTLYPAQEFVKSPDQDGFGIGAIRYSEKIAVPEDL